MTGEVNLQNLIKYIIRGGWPGNIDIPVEQAALLPIQYIDAIIDDDVYRMDGVKRNKENETVTSIFGEKRSNYSYQYFTCKRCERNG